MNYSKLTNIPKLLLISFLCIACSQSDAQKEFENQAFRTPQNITETTTNGELVDGGVNDPDDWRIGPDYRGLIEVGKPAYPNPVLIDDFIFIELDFGFESRIRGLRVFAFSDPNVNIQQIDEITRELSTIETLRISPSLFAGSTGVGLATIYRIVITDQNENVLTYGDVEVRR
ncbi:hypothetical protein G3570_09825 [Balneolaceae bacterium YR4-1]|uniref:Uncharacterized protein n=1 Tax=Halalkalibaculum roseum TaxID=2709311 RepID=A0A6M1SNI6_9BACT|nr:hypothetical protein [Halalkalibaculum roseum]NGP76931.1 hypothetical protein [Halalkalibaculum roseum]